MSNQRLTRGLAILCLAAILLAGCIPEDSLQWSEDGSVGLLRVGEALYLVDGETGELTEIARTNIGVLPDISRDGNLIVYSEQADCNSLSEGLKLLPPGQVKMIEHCAKQVAQDLLDTGGLLDDEFPFPDERPSAPDDPFPSGRPSALDDYRNWAIRYLCENADSELLRILGDKGIEKGKEKSLRYTRIIVAPTNALENKQIVTATLFSVASTRFSPNHKYVAYLTDTQEGRGGYAFEADDLYIASLETNVKAMRVDHPVAFGYDWRQDSRAIAYLSADSKDWSDEDEESVLGSLDERTVADANGGLLAAPVEIPEEGSATTHTCAGKTASLAGIVYYPWLKVTYGSGGRIFFSSIDLPLPVSKRDDPEWSLFCYDSVTGTVANVLPPSVSNHTGPAMSSSQFALSPDGKNVLLPIKNNRFVGYELGTDSMELPIEEDEGFGDDDGLQLAPSWKGNDEITFLVSEKSHYLPKAEEDEGKPARKEIVVLRKTDGDSRILSENWPDEAIP